jgi:hypothetical protein
MEYLLAYLLCFIQASVWATITLWVLQGNDFRYHVAILVFFITFSGDFIAYWLYAIRRALQEH